MKSPDIVRHMLCETESARARERERESARERARERESEREKRQRRKTYWGVGRLVELQK